MFNSYILLIGYADANMPKPKLKCYQGISLIAKNTTQEEKEQEPKLEVCGDAEFCLSLYYRTDVTFKNETDLNGLAGSWLKYCGEKTNNELMEGITEIFGKDITDGCKVGDGKEEAWEDIKVCTINA